MEKYNDNNNNNHVNIERVKVAAALQNSVRRVLTPVVTNMNFSAL
jgi:hypothetical protein